MAAITPDELSARLQSDDEELLVLDIRTEEDFDDWHIPGSWNVDVYDELKNGSEPASDAFGDLPSDREIATVCAVGAVYRWVEETHPDFGTHTPPTSPIEPEQSMADD